MTLSSLMILQWQIAAKSIWLDFLKKKEIFAAKQSKKVRVDVDCGGQCN